MTAEHLEQYANLPLSRNSPAAADLSLALDSDAGQGQIAVTPLYSAHGTPPFLTTGMSGWYSRIVQPLRTAALAEVISEFGRRQTRTGMPGFLFESKRDTIELDMLKNIQGEHEVLNQDANVARRHEDLQKERRKYEAMKARHRRDALDWNPFTYWLLPCCAIITEYAINWESFFKIPYLQNTPAFVFGTVTLVAIVFVWSSHLVGILIKQGRERLGGQVPWTEKRSTIILLVLAIFAFALSMGLIVWGRVLLVDDIIRESRIRTGETSGVDLLWLYGGAMLGNILVWILGVGWSIWKHDSVPDFVETRAKVLWLERWLDKQYKKYLQRRNRRHRLDAAKEQQHLNHEEMNQAETLVGYHDARELFAKLRQKDQEVVGLLADYKSKLIAKVQNMQPAPMFVGKDVTKVDFDITRVMTVEEYAGLPIDLKYCSTS
jgi:hypothetical protein